MSINQVTFTSFVHFINLFFKVIYYSMIIINKYVHIAFMSTSIHTRVQEYNVYNIPNLNS